MTEPLTALFVQIVLAGAAALLARRTKPVAMVLGAAVFFGAPWLAGPNVLLRGLDALLGFILILRVVDTVRTKQAWSASRRLLHVASLVDSRTLHPAPRHVDLRALGGTILWAVVAAVGFYVAHSPERFVRWGGGLVFTYAMIEGAWMLTRALYRAIGFVPPDLHVLPLASVSIGELWGERWARPVSRWLRETCFRPAARRGHPILGLLLGFIASAVGHAYPVLVALDLPMAALMFAFFFVQGLFVMIETLLGASRWPRAASRVWTVVLMVATSPLFVEPALRVLGV